MSRFVDFHRLYEQELVPARAAARAGLERDFAQLSQLCGPAAPASRARMFACLSLGENHATLAATRQFSAREEPDPAGALGRRCLELFGYLPMRWDVAELTMAEMPSMTEDVGSARGGQGRSIGTNPVRNHRRQRLVGDRLLARLCRRLAPAQATRLERVVAAARALRGAGEDDDVLFARALWPIRRTLLAIGEQLVAAGRLRRVDQVFCLSLEQIERAFPMGETGAEELLSLALAAERAWERDRRRLPPQRIIDGRGDWPEESAGPVLHGVGGGGVVEGRVRRIAAGSDLFAAELAGAVVVCASLTPAMAVLLPQASALVADHGGLLSHGACLAREFGLATVVGTRWATRVLGDGDAVRVDGERGCVVRLVGSGHERDNRF